MKASHRAVRRLSFLGTPLSGHPPLLLTNPIFDNQIDRTEHLSNSLEFDARVSSAQRTCTISSLGRRNRPMRIAVQADDGDELAISADFVSIEQAVVTLEIENLLYGEMCEFDSVTLTINKARELAGALLNVADAIESAHQPATGVMSNEARLRPTTGRVERV
jgi:hypothetical protein